MSLDERYDRRTILRSAGVGVLAVPIAGCTEPGGEEGEGGGDGDEEGEDGEGGGEDDGEGEDGGGREYDLGRTGVNGRLRPARRR